MRIARWFSKEWRHAWKWLSVQLGAVTFLAPTMYENIDTIQQFVPQKYFHIVLAGIGILMMLNAVKKKPKRR